MDIFAECPCDGLLWWGVCKMATRDLTQHWREFPIFSASAARAVPHIDSVVASTMMASPPMLRFLLVILFLVSSIDALTQEDEQGNFASKEQGIKNQQHQEDDRTLLDVFGQAAKEYLTTQVIPDTDAACRWNWRHGRCEPFCDCQYQFQWGDFHLGRSCRKRKDGSAPLSQCHDAPPDTLYARVVKQTLQRTNTMTHKTRMALVEWKQRIQEETCADLSEECSENGEQHRSLKQKVLCRHVPSPCDNEEENDEMAMFSSPLDKVNASRMGTKKQEPINSNGNKSNGNKEKDTESSDEADERESSTFSLPRNKANGPGTKQEDAASVEPEEDIHMPL